jgi:hypothetical protein
MCKNYSYLILISSSKPEQISFREYVSILYYDPRMKVYIQNKKVKTKMLVYTLHKPMRYYYMSKKFKSRAEAEVAEATKRLQKAEADKKEATSQFEYLHFKLISYNSLFSS